MMVIPKIFHHGVTALDSYRILFRNGSFLPDESDLQLTEGVVAGSFASMFGQYEHIYLDFFRNNDFSADAPDNLNTTFCGDGFFLFVPARTKPSKPIHIIHLYDELNGKALMQHCNLVMMEAESSAELLIGDYSLSGNKASSLQEKKGKMVNDVTYVLLGAAAALDMVRLQKVTRLNTGITVLQAASSRMKTHYIVLGGEMLHNKVEVKLTGKNAEHIVAGLSLTGHTEHVDNNVRIVHASPDCQSNQLFKHILSDTSTGAFTGRIVVNSGAQKTVAYQRSSNILLHPKAKMNIQPQLEIYADDVKCSHGATVGQLDAEALFYLRSRGIGEAEAKKMLLQAFASEVLDGISCKPFREKILKELRMDS